MKPNFILKGHILFSRAPETMDVTENGYLVCADGVCAGVYAEIPEAYAGLPVHDCGDKLIVPGLTDLHVHAPQYTFRVARHGYGAARLVEYLHLPRGSAVCRPGLCRAGV